MKLLFLAFFSGIILIGHSQTTTTKTKTVSVDPKKSAEVRTKLEQMKPPAAQTPKTQKTPPPQALKSANKGSKTPSVSNPNAKPFPFSGTFTVNYDDKNKNGLYNSGKIKYAFDGVRAAIIPNFSNLRDVSSMRSVVDVSAKEMTMLTTDVKGKKKGLLMNMPKSVIKTADPKEKQPIVKKTAETKMIQGFKCEKYIVTMDTVKIESWVTGEIDLNMSELISLTNAGFKGKSPFGSTNLENIPGAALETTITQKDGAVMKMSITDIKKIKPEAALFSTDGFTVSDVRGLPMFGAQ